MSAHAEHAGRIVKPRADTFLHELTALRATPLDIAGYWLGLIGSYVLLLGLWYYAAEEKIIGGHLNTPPPITKQFSGSLFASVPGTSAAWVILAILEGVVFVGLAVSVVRGEFLPHRTKSWLLGSAILSLFVLALLVLGNSMTGQHDSVASLFTYFASTAIVIGFVRMMPPYRSDNWLSGQTAERH